MNDISTAAVLGGGATPQRSEGIALTEKFTTQVWCSGDDWETIAALYRKMFFNAGFVVAAEEIKHVYGNVVCIWRLKPGTEGQIRLDIL